MVNAANVAAAIISFASLVLVAISMATNWWVKFTFPRTDPSAPTVNPFVTNTDLTGLRLEYDLDYFGLWVGCHREQSFNKISCGFIGSSCYSNICWTRNRKEKTCLDSRVSALSKCLAYRVTRGFMVLGTLWLIIGAAILLVSTCVTSQNLVWAGTAFTGLASIFLMISFAVFYNNVFKQGGLNEISDIAWSFVMLIVSWPLAVIATIMGALGAFSTPSKAYGVDDEFDD